MEVDAAPTSHPASPSDGGRADRAMRRLLRITTAEPQAVGEAHRAFRISLVVSGVRCLISYLVIPVLVPLLSFAGVLAAPIGIALCAIAVVNGIVSLRRFWSSNHRSRWMYTGFMAVVFVVLAIALYSDVSRLVAAA